MGCQLVYVILRLSAQRDLLTSPCQKSLNNPRDKTFTFSSQRDVCIKVMSKYGEPKQPNCTTPLLKGFPKKPARRLRVGLALMWATAE